MSWRRSLSFSTDEEDLKNHFDTGGRSDFAKEAMKFFIKFRDKVFIVPDGMSFNHSPKTAQIPKNNIKKFIK
jgi:hypothetical protein